MKSLYLKLACYRKPVLTSEKTFVIGVKGNEDSLDMFEKLYPEFKIERLPEVVNARYMYDSPENHILQPAFVWKED